MAEALAQRMVTEAESIWDLSEQHEVNLRTAAYAHALQRVSDAVDATGSVADFRPLGHA